jgi:hypothetical protein
MWYYLLLVFFAYIIYKIVRFAIPIYQASKQMQRQFKEMQRRMQPTPPPSTKSSYTKKPTAKTTTSVPSSKISKGDYIDFEEVK